MRLAIIGVVSIGSLLAASSPLIAQDSTVTPITGSKPYQATTTPGMQGTAPLSAGGAGADSKMTGYSEGGRGGTGGTGGILDNGTSDGSGTATGGNPGGKLSQGGGGG